MYGIVGLEQLEVADVARPLEAAEDDVIAVKRPVAADEGLRLEQAAQGLQALAERHEPFLAAGLNDLEAGAEAFLARRAEIRFVLLVDMLPDVEDHEPRNGWVEDRVGPA